MQSRPLGRAACGRDGRATPEVGRSIPSVASLSARSRRRRTRWVCHWDRPETARQQRSPPATGSEPPIRPGIGRRLAAAGAAPLARGCHAGTQSLPLDHLEAPGRCGPSASGHHDVLSEHQLRPVCQLPLPAPEPARPQARLGELDDRWTGDGVPPDASPAEPRSNRRSRPVDRQ